MENPRGGGGSGTGGVWRSGRRERERGERKLVRFGTVCFLFSFPYWL